MKPFERNYRDRVAGARAGRFTTLADYLEKRFSELEPNNPYDEDGIHGLSWSDQVEGKWKIKFFWSSVNLKFYNNADNILRAQRPDLYAPSPLRKTFDEIEVERLKIDNRYLKAEVERLNQYVKDLQDLLLKR